MTIRSIIFLYIYGTRYPFDPYNDQHKTGKTYTGEAPGPGWEKSIFVAQGVMVLMKSCILPAHVVHLDGVAHLAINGYPPGQS